MNQPMQKLSAVVAMALTTAGGDANAYGRQYRHGTSGFDVEPRLVLAYGYDRGPGYTEGLGFGLRFGAPLWPNGPLTSIHNSLMVSFGADCTYWGGAFQRASFWGNSGMVTPTMLQWNFYLARSLPTFSEGGVAFGIAGCAGCRLYATPGYALGTSLHLDGSAGYPVLVFRPGSPIGLTIGIAL